MTYYCDSVKAAKSIAFGSRPAVTIAQYFDAWQYLYDNNVPLDEADTLYLDKLICDGSIVTPENFDELGGIPHYPITGQ